MLYYFTITVTWIIAPVNNFILDRLCLVFIVTPHNFPWIYTFFFFSKNDSAEKFYSLTDGLIEKVMCETWEEPSSSSTWLLRNSPLHWSKSLSLSLSFSISLPLFLCICVCVFLQPHWSAVRFYTLADPSDRHMSSHRERERELTQLRVSRDFNELLYWINNPAEDTRPSWVDMELTPCGLAFSSPWPPPNLHQTQP